MAVRFLLDTHVLIRWLVDPGKLSRDQMRVVRNSVLATEPLGISAMSLIEIALLTTGRGSRIKGTADHVLTAIKDNPVLSLFPITLEIASEVATLGDALRDPADRTIVATARVHRLKLVTSDQRIIESGLVPVVE